MASHLPGDVVQVNPHDVIQALHSLQAGLQLAPAYTHTLAQHQHPLRLYHLVFALWHLHRRTICHSLMEDLRSVMATECIRSCSAQEPAPALYLIVALRHFN